MFQAEDGIRDAQESRGLGDVYKRQLQWSATVNHIEILPNGEQAIVKAHSMAEPTTCLLYTSDAADELLCVDLGGRRTIKNKHTISHAATATITYT